MISIVDKVIPLNKAGPPGIHFLLENRHDRNSSPVGIDNIEIISPSHNSSTLREIFINNQAQLKDIVDSAFHGQTGSIGFAVESEGKNHYYELHCFPNSGDNHKSVGCLLVDRTKEQSERARVDSQIYELGLISQAVRAFAETRNLSEILRIILLAVTAGSGLGFNRGFILLADDSRECLWGCMGTGSSSPEEAGKIWNELSRNPMTFNEMLRLYKAGGAYDGSVNEMILTVRIPLSGEQDFIARAAMQRQPMIVGPEMIKNDNDLALKEKFGVDNMAVVPLLSQNSLQGVILADNIITRRPILQTDLNLLEIFARYASDAIENSRLYGKLEHQVELLKEANENIIRSRENLIRAEKLSSIGRMALLVAHEVRNPLTIIGGYANLRLRKTGADDPSRHTLELISRQARRIEKTLDRFSSVVRMSGKEEGKFLLVELITETLGMLSTETDPLVPRHTIGRNLCEAEIFVDKGLFHQSLMAILREAAGIAGGMRNISLDVDCEGNSALIFIDGGESNPKFAENFYSGLRDRKDEERYQNMAVALEILRHYGGDIGIGSSEGTHGRLYIHIPLREEKV